MQEGPKQYSWIDKMPVASFPQKLWKAVLLSVIIVGITFLLSLFNINPESPKLIRQNAESFDLYDIAFSGGDKGLADRDSTIILVKLDTSRKAIADQLLLINQYKPAVIALDAIFADEDHGPGDNYLATVIQQTGTITAIEIGEENDKAILVRNYFDTDGGKRFQAGYTNFYEEDSVEYPVTRSFQPFLKDASFDEYSFAAKVAEKYAPDKMEKLRKRNRQVEWINYTALAEHYYQFTTQDLLTMDAVQLSEKIKGNIVLLGHFAGPGEWPDLEDLHYTPMNSEMLAKSPPDSYGVVIQANIITMILNEEYINAKSNFLSWILAGIFIFLFYLFHLCYPQVDKWPAILKFFFHLAWLTTIVGIFIALFAYCRIRVPLFPIIATYIVYEILPSIVETVILSQRGILKLIDKWKQQKAKPQVK